MMTPYVWLNFFIILAGNLGFCIAMYLTYEAINNKDHWLNPKNPKKWFAIVDIVRYKLTL